MIKDKLKSLLRNDPNHNSDIEKRFESWIANISIENKSLFERIFCDIEYYSENDLRSNLQSLYGSINKKDDFIDNTLVLAIESQYSKFNSSMYMTGFLVEANNIAANYCTMEEMKAKNYKPKNIVFCDDFIGSGKTIIDFINKHTDLIRDKKIYIICIHCMNEGENSIRNFAKKNGLDIEILFHKTKNKYFSDDKKDEKNEYTSECKKMKIKHPLGMYESEALVVTYKNTPNNTLGVIWEETEKNEPVFPRKHTKIPKCREMKKEKKIRRMENYYNGRKN